MIKTLIALIALIATCSAAYVLLVIPMSHPRGIRYTYNACTNTDTGEITYWVINYDTFVSNQISQRNFDDVKKRQNDETFVAITILFALLIILIALGIMITL